LGDAIGIRKSVKEALSAAVRFMTRVEFAALIHPTTDMPPELLE
jgi:hypothetical protein